MSTLNKTESTRCPTCGEDNRCGLANPATATQPCWCFRVTIEPQTLTQSAAAENRSTCLCPECIQAQQPITPDAT